MGIMKQAPGMIRAFLALEISDVSKDWIEERKREMARSMKGTVRWVKREGLHITLHFFGEIPSEAVEKVGDVLTPRVVAFPPLILGVKGIGVFPNRRNPRVLWAGIEERDGEAWLRKLYAALQEAIEKEGFPVEKRPFTAHVTIGRVKKSPRIAWENFRDLPPCPPFAVNEVVLFQSILTPKGSIYRSLKHFSLGGTKDD